MVNKIESPESNGMRATALLTFCQKLPHTFISIDDLRKTYDWSFGSALEAIKEARKRLSSGAIYTIFWENGIVYEPAHVASGEKIFPSKLRPEPTWVKEYPQHTEIHELLNRLRYARIVSITEARMPLTQDEYVMSIRMLGHYVDKRFMPARTLTTNEKISVSGLGKKLPDETEGEWSIVSERRAGVCYILQHTNA